MITTHELTRLSKANRVRSRIDFEEWAKEKELDISPYTYNMRYADLFSYQDIETQMFWECWGRATTRTIDMISAKIVKIIHEEGEDDD